MNISAALASLGINDSIDVFTGVRMIRELIQNQDPAIELTKAKEVLKVLGVEDSILTDDNASRARLFATSLASVALSDREAYQADLPAAIEKAKEKVENLEKMGLVQKSRKAKAEKPAPIKKEKVAKEKASKPAKQARIKPDLEVAIAIFKAAPEDRVYDLVTRVAEAYGVDRAKAYSILHKARKA
jgi:hypothetical protein